MPTAPPAPSIDRVRARALAVAWAWLLLLWLTAWRLPSLPPWAWLLAVLGLAALPAWGLWLGFMLRKRALRLQLAPDACIWRLLSSPWWSALRALVVAVALTTAALWQAYFLAAREWALLALAVPVYLLISRVLERWLAPQFSEPAFSWRWSESLARWVFVLLLSVVWLGLVVWWGALDARALTPAMPAEALDQAIAEIQAARSGLVRWGLDLLLALQVTGGVLRELPQSSHLRLVLLILAGPGLMSLMLAQVLRGASGLQTQLRHAARLRPKSTASTMFWGSFFTVVGAAIALASVANLDGWAKRRDSPLALQRLPQCEQIEGQYYRIGTATRVRELALQALGQARAGAPLCARLDALGPELEQAVERYLDWYFSLGAEWGRVLRLLAGDAEAFLQRRLEQELARVPGLPDAMQLSQQQGEHALAVYALQQAHIREVLDRHHLALGAGQCLVQARLGTLPGLGQLSDARQRLGASTAVGVGAGAFAGLIAAKAMSKAGMKAAAKVLAKAAAKQGLGKAGAVAAGAALGSVLPGAGTAAGALAGAAVGTAVGIGIDWTALRAEELLTRDGLRTELHTAVHEQLQDMRQALGCTAP